MIFTSAPCDYEFTLQNDNIEPTAPADSTKQSKHINTYTATLQYYLQLLLPICQTVYK